MRSAHRARGAHASQLEFSRRRVLVCGAPLAVAIGALFGGGSALAATTPRAVTPTYLFSIPTASGSLTGRNDRHLTLRLTGTRNYLTRFTDRPLRQAFVVANVDFARRFRTYFAASDPNAVLTHTPPGAKIPVSIVVTVGHPRWSAHDHKWTFSATRIRKQPDNLPGTTVHIKPPLIPNPHSFKNATLLIDGGSASVGNPGELPGEGIAESLSAFATTMPGIAGDHVSISVGVEYSYALTSPDGAVTSPALVPVLLANDPNGDLRVQPNSPLCEIEARIVTWQDIFDPSPVDGAYILDLTLRSSGQPFSTDTLRYTSVPGGLVSPACSGSTPS